MKTNFVHLRAQSSYSMLESALSVDHIVDLAATDSMPAICLADRGNLFGSLEFAIAAAKKGVQPLNGSILNISYSGNGKQEFAQILLIAKDEPGYQNLLKLVSFTFTKNDRKICEHITLQDLKQYQQGIIALSCYSAGISGKLLLANNVEGAVTFAKELQDIFQDRFYFEIMRHNLTEEEHIEKAYLNIALDLGIPVVATNAILFCDIGMHEAHDVLLCIAGGVTKEVEERKRTSDQCYFKTRAEMMELFKDLPEALENTVNIAKRCCVMSEVHSPMLPNFAGSCTSEEELIRNESRAGLLARLEAKFEQENIPLLQQAEITEEYMARLEYELNIICSMNFSGYFLIVSDFIKWSKEQGISVGPGRGSGAGSIVAWSLLITDLDPIKFGLLFERFLNPERISMPDFDIDFCQERREEVISYVRSKYGDNKVGQIITFGKLQAKAVIKDVSRVLGLKFDYANYLTELVPFNAVNPVTLKQAIEEVAELKEAAAGRGLYNFPGEQELIKQVLETALSLEGLHRHASVHAAGIVIAGKDLTEIVPVYKDKDSSMLVVQYSMKYADLAGLIKFDFLGLQTLTVITKCRELLKQQGIEIYFDNNFTDKKTYALLSKGLGVGVFQFESPGMKDTLRRLRPDCIEDIIALGALYRPGPMDNIPTYIACKHGKQKPDYLHPLLKPLLEKTYGVIIYQEQVLEIAKVLAGYTLGAADLLRKAMGKKIKAGMEEQETLFINGAKANGVSQEQAQSIFETLAKFAGYGFNKSHASAYGVISYQTAYLKANFPVEFLVASMNLDIDNNDKINLFIQEARNSGIKIIPPDINSSNGLFTIGYEENNCKTILYAFGAIKGMTKSFGDIVAQERKHKGLFKDIIDFIERTPPKSLNKRALENLIKAGGFDSLHANRNSLLESIPKLISHALSYHREKESNQFSLIDVSTNNHKILIEAKQLSQTVQAFQEFEVLGLFIRSHPLSKYKDILPRFDIYNSLNLQNDLKKGSCQLKIAGLIQKKDARMSSRGRFITLQLSDQFGIFDITIFSEEVLKNYVHLLDIKTLVVAYCDAFKDEGGIKLTARSFSSIEEVVNKARFDLRLNLKNHDELRSIIDLLKNRTSQEQSNAQITLLLPEDSGFVAQVKLPDSFHIESQDLKFLKNFSQ